MSANLKQLLKAVKYNNPQKLMKDVQKVTASFPKLKVCLQSPTFLDWSTDDLLVCVQGTIPVECSCSLKADVDVTLFLPENYPDAAPAVYLRCSDRTVGSPGKFWDKYGKVALSFLKEWQTLPRYHKHDLHSLIMNLQGALEGNCDSFCTKCSIRQSMAYMRLDNSAQGPPEQTTPTYSPSYQEIEAVHYYDDTDLVHRDPPTSENHYENIIGNDDHVCTEYHKRSESKVEDSLPPAIPPRSSSRLSRKHTVQATLPSYSVDPYLPGVLYVVNIEKFSSKQYKERKGSAMDISKITGAFRKFNFEIDVAEDLNARSLRKKLIEWTGRPLLHKVSSCVVALMSHGEEGEFITADGEAVKLTEIISYFNGRSCPMLNGKPKMFVIQACRGSTIDTGVGLEHESANQADIEYKITADAKAMQKIPAEGDMVYAFSTMPGHLSWRHVDNGSWYIDAFCKVFGEYANDVDVSHMLVMINNKVATEYSQESGGKQMPMPTVGLRKYWYLTGSDPEVAQH